MLKEWHATLLAMPGAILLQPYVPESRLEAA